MSLPQQKSREIVFQLLYSQDLGNDNPQEIVTLLMKQLSTTKKNVREAQERVSSILEKENEIDAIIAKTSLSYAFERIQSVEKNILRLGIYELLYDNNIPPKVAISEAMRLARKFGSPESAGFVNAILDNVFKVSQGIKIDEKSLSDSARALETIEEISTQASQATQPPPEIENE